MSHSACPHQGRVDSWLLMVGSQTASLTPGASFAHNLCCRCPNGPCEAIFDMYASRPFQRYKEHFKARCFYPWNRVLSFWESRRTPKSPFRECEWRPHTSLKVGLRQDPSQKLMKNRKQMNFDNNNDKLSHAWPRDPQQKWIQTLDAKPFPLFSHTTALLHYHVHITWLGQQTNRPGKKQHPYHP
jgi:hypothetical protein